MDKSWADLGNAYSQSQLGWHYENGEGVEKDLSAAYYYYSLGKENGNEFAKESIDEFVEKYPGIDENNYLVSENNVLSLMERENYDLINKLEELEYPVYFTYNQILTYIELDNSLQYRNKKMLLDIIDDTIYKLITIAEDYENSDDEDIESQKENLFSIIDNI